MFRSIYNWAAANVIGTVVSHTTVDLMNAIETNSIPLATQIINAGININSVCYSESRQQDFDQRTPLFYACYKDRLEIANLLIASGADVNKAEESYRKTPLMAVVENCNLEIVKLLGENHADLNIVDDRDKNALHHAAENMHASLPIIDYLISKGIELNRRDEEGRTPLAMAAMIGQPEAAARLLSAGCDPHIAGNDGNTALHLAMFAPFPNTRPELVRLLTESGASLDTPNAEGLTPRMFQEQIGLSDVAISLPELIVLGDDDMALSNESTAQATPSEHGMEKFVVEQEKAVLIKQQEERNSRHVEYFGRLFSEQNTSSSSSSSDQPSYPAPRLL